MFKFSNYYFQDPDWPVEEVLDTYDSYHIGDAIEHPKFGTGVIMDIFGESVNRCVTIELASS